MDDVLARIVRRKQQRELPALRERCEREEWSARVADLPPTPDFEAALRRPGRIRVIAEIKRRSPSAGVLREPFEPGPIAARYREYGADAISVLTDEEFFGGSIEHLAEVAQAGPTPVLRKDFVLEEAQLDEARLRGAAAALLIAECLSPERLADLVGRAAEIGLATLVELHDRENLPAVLRSGTRLVGVNNRDLRTFETDLAHTLDLVPEIPPEVLLVSESGIRTGDDVRRLARAGVGAILVGEAFMRAPDPGAKLAELLE